MQQIYSASSFFPPKIANSAFQADMFQSAAAVMLHKLEEGRNLIVKFDDKEGIKMIEKNKYICSDRHTTAVKSNALAELMNRASKIHWKNMT